MSELGIPCASMVVYEDNIGAIGWAGAGPAKHFLRCKHVNLRYNYVLEVVRTKHIKLFKVPTEAMHGDLLTKALRPSEFHKPIGRIEIFTTSSAEQQHGTYEAKSSCSSLWEEQLTHNAGTNWYLSYKMHEIKKGRLLVKIPSG